MSPESWFGINWNSVWQISPATKWAHRGMARVPLHSVITRRILEMLNLANKYNLPFTWIRAIRLVHTRWSKSSFHWKSLKVAASPFIYLFYYIHCPVSNSFPYRVMILYYKGWDQMGKRMNGEGVWWEGRNGYKEARKEGKEGKGGNLRSTEDGPDYEAGTRSWNTLL